MGFKKLTNDEIQFAMYENILGLPQSKKIEMVMNDNQIYKARKKIESDYQSLDKSIAEQNKDLIINYEKFEEIQIDSNKKMTARNENNILSIKNPSSRDSLWNLNIISKKNGINKFIEQLKPNTEFNESFTEIQKEEPILLKVDEYISTSQYEELKQKNNCYLEKNTQNSLYYCIKLENNTDYVCTDINLIKSLPVSTEKIVEFSNLKGEVNPNNKKVVWQIKELQPKEITTLKMKINVAAKETHSGKINVTYRINNSQDKKVEFDTISVNLKNAQFIHINEVDNKPGFWNCALTFLNQTEFKIQITSNELYIIQGKKKESLKKIDQIIGINSFEEKQLMQVQIESKTQPILQKNIVYQPTFKVENKYSYSLEFSDVEIPIIDICVEKVFNVKSVKSYEQTDFISKITLSNDSTIPINHLLIVDSIPRDFTIKDINQIEIIKGNKNIKYSNFTREKKSNSMKEELEILQKQLSNNQERKNKLENELKEKEDFLNKYQNETTDYKNGNLENELNQLNSTYNEKTAQKKQIESKKEELEKGLAENENDTYNLTKTLQEKQDLAKIYEEKKKIISDIASQEQALNTIRTQMKKFQEEYKELNENLIVRKEEIDKISNDKDPSQQNNKSKLQSAYKKLELKKHEIEKQITLTENHEKELVKKTESLSKTLADVEKQTEKAEKFEDLLKTISSIRQKIKEKENQNKDLKTKIFNLNQEIQVIQNNLQQNSNKKEELSKKIKDKIELNEKIKLVKKEKEEILNNLAKLNDVLEVSKDNTQKLFVLMDPNTSDSTKIELLINEFSRNSQIKSDSVFNVYFFEESREHSNLIIFVTNLNQILESIGKDESIQILIPMKANNPTEVNMYKFPATVYYDFIPLMGIQKIDLNENNLPKLVIEHKRKKITLGKIIDIHSSNDVFTITILIRNNSSEILKNLRIVDTLPESSEILNAYSEYEEKNKGEGVKEVVWKIQSVPPLFETQINYLIKNSNKKVSIDSFELKMEME